MTSLDFLVSSRPYGRIGHAGSAYDPDDADPTSFPAYHVSPAHDPTLLFAALAEIEARRAAIEWLLEADLLRKCLV